MLKYKPTKHKPVLTYGACTPKDIVIRTTKLYNNNKSKKKWRFVSKTLKSKRN